MTAGRNPLIAGAMHWSKNGIACSSLLVINGANTDGDLTQMMSLSSIYGQEESKVAVFWNEQNFQLKNCDIYMSCSGLKWSWKSRIVAATRVEILLMQLSSPFQISGLWRHCLWCFGFRMVHWGLRIDVCGCIRWNFDHPILPSTKSHHCSTCRVPDCGLAHVHTNTIPPSRKGGSRTVYASVRSISLIFITRLLVMCSY